MPLSSVRSVRSTVPPSSLACSVFARRKVSDRGRSPIGNPLVEPCHAPVGLLCPARESGCLSPLRQANEARCTECRVHGEGALCWQVGSGPAPRLTQHYRSGSPPTAALASKQQPSVRNDRYQPQLRGTGARPSGARCGAGRVHRPPTAQGARIGVRRSARTPTRM